MAAIPDDKLCNFSGEIYDTEDNQLLRGDYMKVDCNQTFADFLKEKGSKYGGKVVKVFLYEDYFEKDFIIAKNKDFIRSDTLQEIYETYDPDNVGNLVFRLVVKLDKTGGRRVSRKAKRNSRRAYCTKRNRRASRTSRRNN